MDIRRGMVNCIFHDDRTPSMKLYEDHYHCFGCGAHGDAVSLAAQLTGLSQYEAARQLCDAFGVVYDSKSPPVRKYERLKTQKEKEQEVFRVLSDYYHFLEKCREVYAPVNSDEKLHPLFIESLTRQSDMAYYCDIFISGTKEEREKFMTERSNYIADIRKRMETAETIEERQGNAA